MDKPIRRGHLLEVPDSNPGPSAFVNLDWIASARPAAGDPGVTLVTYIGGLVLAVDCSLEVFVGHHMDWMYSKMEREGWPPREPR